MSTGPARARIDPKFTLPTQRESNSDGAVGQVKNSPFIHHDDIITLFPTSLNNSLLNFLEIWKEGGGIFGGIFFNPLQ
jgi:hypothetical protein